MKKRMAGLLAVALGASVLVAGPFAIRGARADCTCRYDGNSYEFGTMVCLRTPQGLRLARCGMVQNNTFWDFLDSPCPTASSAPPAVSPTPRTMRDSRPRDQRLNAARTG